MTVEAGHKRHTSFRGRLIILGFGIVGQAVLPLILRHTSIDVSRLMIVTATEDGAAIAAKFGVRYVTQPITPDNYNDVLDPLLNPGDFLLNVTYEVSSVALIQLCQRKRVLYLDTCIEPWPGGYTDPRLSPSLRSSYALREAALALRTDTRDTPTAVVTHGANPGLVSYFVKQALLDLAEADGIAVAPTTRTEWAELAHLLGIRVIHIAERDSQVANVSKRPGEFVNTWSVEGFVTECMQPAELGWGTHEKFFPSDAGRHEFGCGSAIYLTRPGAATRVRSWTPLQGSYHGFLTAHGESISIADYLSLKNGDHTYYRPTVHYAYHPCDDAVLSVHEFAGRNWQLQDRQRLLLDNLIGGVDELGVLLMGHGQTVYWYGSRLSVLEARDLAPHNNATSLQVAISVLAGMIWAIENPQCGVVEPDEIDFRKILPICMPYLGEVVGVHGDWSPLVARGHLFTEDVDTEDPWQFKNFRVV